MAFASFQQRRRETTFTGQETELIYPITVPQPDPIRYKPLTNQRATVTFKMNGVQVAKKTINAPEAPYQQLGMSIKAQITMLSSTDGCT